MRYVKYAELFNTMLQLYLSQICHYNLLLCLLLQSWNFLFQAINFQSTSENQNS